MASAGKHNTSSRSIKVKRATFERVMNEASHPKPANAALIAFIAKGKALLASR